VVRTFALSHQGPCAGIVVLWRGRKLCYVTDHEHGDAKADERLNREVGGADLLIYDATFTDAEMPSHEGWGHSSWEEGVRLKQRAGVRLLALAHHEPARTDAALDELAQSASQLASNVFFAKQGLSLSL
jgi:phosphoribosyl 1,2-cyclic phosphodiesterase